jgi:hypothetical protein
MLAGVNAMRLVASAPERSLYSFSQSYRGPWMYLAFFFTLLADAFRSLLVRKQPR